MIRLATKYDRKEIIEILLEFQKHVIDVPKVKNENHINTLLDNIFAGQGAIFYKEGQGLLMSVVFPSVWCDKTLILHELAWYVKPEFRNTSTGYRLLKAYTDFGNKLKEEGRIDMFTICKMVNSPDVKFGKFGFAKHNDVWLQ